MTIAELRREYARYGLTEADAHPDPTEQFRQWFDQAVTAGIPDANAMALATTRPDGRPAVRVVLLKGFGADGYVFFSNYQSQKGRELASDPRAALMFYWPDLERQVRIEGSVERTSAEESDAYFRTRPRDSQLAAWASPQSDGIPSRQDLERRVADLQIRYPDSVPRPPHWGGYRLTANRFEFWQGRPGRLHDRLEYTQAPGFWHIRRLAP